MIKSKECLNKTYISLVQHLQRKLPLDSSFLKDFSCLNPAHKGKGCTLIAIGRNIAAILHVVTPVGVSYMSFLFLLQPGIVT